MTKIRKEEKEKKEEGIRVQTPQCIVLALLLLLLPLEFSSVARADGGAELLITDFFSCDSLGTPYDYFPMKTTVYFNVALTNLASDPENITINVSVLDYTSVPIGLDQLNTTISKSCTEHYIMSVYIPKWARLGFATAYGSVFARGKLVDGESAQFYIGPEDRTPPVVSLLSPENVTYRLDSVPLVFTVNERSLWMGYSLNNQANVTVEGNIALAGLANGQYNLVVYANDTSGNMGFSQVHFTILIVHDVAITSLQCSPSQVYMGQSVSVSISVQNEGDTAETFNVSIHANTNTIETLTVTNLPAGNNAILQFTWDTAGLAKGSYTIRSTAHPVLGETDTADNTYPDRTVNIMARPDIELASVVSSKRIVGQGYSVQIEVTATNRGDQTEVFNVTAYANSTQVQTKTVTSTHSNSTIIMLLWNTAGFAKGNYTIMAIAWPLPNETDTADNTLVDGWIFITIPGDVDGDRDIDIFDIVLISKLYGASQANDPRYNPTCDIDGDGNIGIYDIAVAAGRYGDRW